jgi:low temperature requirement protein LtrA
MVEQRQVRRGGGVLRGVRPTGEDDRVTTFELFFDLVGLCLAGEPGTGR